MGPHLDRGKEKLRFSEHISGSYEYLIMKSFLVARSYRDKHQMFDYRFSSYPENEAQSPDFGRYWAFFRLFVLVQALSLGH